MAEQIASLYAKIGADTSGLNRGLGDASNALHSFGSTVGGVARTAVVAFAAIGAAALAAVGASVKSAADFEQTMSGVKAVSGATAQEMKQLTDLTLQLGKDTVYSAGEAGKGIEELIKGGVSIADIMNGAAQATLNLASAGEVSLTDAAEIAANAMAMFNLTGEDMVMVSDQIAGAANASSLSVSDFKFSLAAAGAVAAQSGQEFGDLAEAIAIMGKNGLKGQDAGTSLKTMLMNLQPTTKRQVAAMRELGLITKDGTNKFITATGSFKSMAEIAEELQTATEGLTDAQKMQYLEMIFGSDAIRAAAILANEGAEGFDAMAKSMGKVTAESVASTKLDNLNGSLEQLKGSLETAAIALGTAFLPAIRGLVDGATKIVNEQIMPAIETYKNAFAANGFKGVFEQAIKDLQGISGQLMDWLGKQWQGIDWAMVTKGAIDLGGQIIANAGNLAGRLAGWIGQQLGAIKWKEVWQGVGDIWDGFTSALRNAFAPAVTNSLTGEVASAGGIATQIQTWLGSQFSKISWPAVWKSITDVTKGMIAALGDIYTDVTTWLNEQFAKVEWKTVWASVTGVAKNLADGLGDIAGDVTTWLAKQWAGVDWVVVWGGAKGPQVAVPGGISLPEIDFDLGAWIENLKNSVIELLGNIGPWIQEFQASGGFRAVGEGIAQGIGDALGAAGRTERYINKVASSVFPLPHEILGAIAGSIGALAYGIASTLANFILSGGFADVIDGAITRAIQMALDSAGSKTYTINGRTGQAGEPRRYTGGGRAGGGPVLGGQTFLVGEKGPELFSANMAGTILSADKTAKLASGIAQSVNVFRSVGSVIADAARSISGGFAYVPPPTGPSGNEPISYVPPSYGPSGREPSEYVANEADEGQARDGVEETNRLLGVLIDIARQIAAQPNQTTVNINASDLLGRLRAAGVSV